MTGNDIDAIRKLTDAATPGPWAIESYDVAYVEGYRVVDARVDYVAGNFDNEAGGVLRCEDAEFIAVARTHVPALCDEVEQLRAQVVNVRRICEQYADVPPPLYQGPGLSKHGEGCNAGTRDMARAIRDTLTSKEHQP